MLNSLGGARGNAWLSVARGPAAPTNPDKNKIYIYTRELGAVRVPYRERMRRAEFGWRVFAEWKNARIPPEQCIVVDSLPLTLSAHVPGELGKPSRTVQLSASIFASVLRERNAMNPARLTTTTGDPRRFFFFFDHSARDSNWKTWTIRYTYKRGSRSDVPDCEYDDGSHKDFADATGRPRDFYRNM